MLLHSGAQEQERGHEKKVVGSDTGMNSSEKKKRLRINKIATPRWNWRTIFSKFFLKKQNSKAMLWAGLTKINLTRLCDYSLCRRCAGNNRILEVVLVIRSVSSLIDDSNPFGFSLINEDFLEFIIYKVWDDLLYGQQIHLNFQTLDSNDLEKQEELQIAVSNSFRHAAILTDDQLVHTVSEGCASIGLSVAVMIVCAAILVPIVVTFRGETIPVWVAIIVSIHKLFDEVLYGQEVTIILHSLDPKDKVKNTSPVFEIATFQTIDQGSISQCLLNPINDTDLSNKENNDSEKMENVSKPKIFNM